MFYARCQNPGAHPLLTYRWRRECGGEPLFGFRGTFTGGDGRKWARLVLAVNDPGEIIVPDIPVDCLPYVPDMSAGSDFQKNGKWHHYEVESGYSVTGVEIDSTSIRTTEIVLDGRVLFHRDPEEVQRELMHQRRSFRPVEIEE